MAAATNDVLPSAREREAIVLRAVIELISSIVNYEVLEKADGPITEVRFPSQTHLRFFNIMLVDFLSPIDATVLAPGGTYLEGLEAICESPTFELFDSATELKRSVAELDTWLATEISVDTWMPSIDIQASLKLTRSLLIQIGGNASKHNHLRLGRIATKLQGILARAGHETGRQQAVLALSDVYDRFHKDILHYHSSTIAELLNNVWWGIHDYLQPEYQRSFTREPPHPIKYHYKVPSDVQTALGIDAYWGLMNLVRSGPYLPRFAVSEWLKKRY